MAYYIYKKVCGKGKILSKECIEEAKSSLISSGNNVNPDCTQGYDFQFWSVEMEHIEQHIILDLLWRYLLPGMSDQNIQQDKVELEKIDNFEL